MVVLSTFWSFAHSTQLLPGTASQPSCCIFFFFFKLLPARLFCFPRLLSLFINQKNKRKIEERKKKEERRRNEAPALAAAVIPVPADTRWRDEAAAAPAERGLLFLRRLDSTLLLLCFIDCQLLPFFSSISSSRAQLSCSHLFFPFFPLYFDSCPFKV